MLNPLKNKAFERLMPEGRSRQSPGEIPTSRRVRVARSATGGAGTREVKSCKLMKNITFLNLRAAIAHPS
jgi:hypothetical protein